MSSLAILIVVVGAAQRIHATECDLNSFSQADTVNPGTTDANVCAIGCNNKEFTCTARPSLTFTASCQESTDTAGTGEWSATNPGEAERCRQTCVWTWTSPPSSATSITRSVGASTTFIVSVNDALAATNTVTSKLGEMELSVRTYGSDGNFEETSTTKDVTFTPELGGGSSNNEYTLIHPGFVIEDNGKTISIESGGCDSDVSSSITLVVKYCDKDAFDSVNNGGTTDNAACGNGCEATFTCTGKTDLSFTATCGEDGEWGATTPVQSERCLRACVWTWTNPSSGTTLTRSVGASASFSVTVDDTLTSSTVVTWKSGDDDLTIQAYDESKFDQTSNDGNVIFTHTPGTPNTYAIDWPSGGVVEGDNGKVITVLSGGCEAGGTSPAITLEVKYCDKDAFDSANNPGTTDNAACGNGCEATFTCTARPGLTFKATCQEDASWTTTTPVEVERCLQTCTWEWTNPSSGSTLTRSVGAPAATLGVSVNDALGNENTVTWKLGETELTVQTYNSGGTTFQETSNAGNVIFNFVPGDASSNNAYTITHPGFVIGDNGKAITVVSTGCDSDGTSSGITVEVKYCDLAVYGNTATAATNADCAYNCERTFTCAGNSGKSFQATCRENATWSVADAPCAGMKEGVLFGLVILCTYFSDLICRVDKIY